jgi:hypothetical protein
MADVSVLLTSLTHGAPRIEWVDGLFDLVLWEIAQEDCVLFQPKPVFKKGPYIDKNRNYLTDVFLSTEATHLFMVDHDVRLPASVLRAMLAAKADVVALDMPMVNGAHCGYTQASPYTFRAVEMPKDPSVNGVYCDAVATSAILIEREILEEISAAYGMGSWFNREYVFDEELGRVFDVGEDLSFCMRVQKCGGQCLLLLGADVSHYKVGRFRPDQKPEAA